MDITEKRTAAFELLARTDIRRSNYEPPMLRLLWRLGIDMPPPHFAGVVSNAVFLGVPVGIGGGLGKLTANVFLNQSGAVLSSGCITAVVYGLIMAAYYAYSAHKHGIPRWAAFDGLPESEQGT